MNIITIEEIENMLERLHPKLDVSTLIQIEDKDLSKILKHYWFLQQCERDIQAHFSFTYKEILYSQYYWFVQFKHHYFLKIGYDGGLDEQLGLLIEKICNEVGEAVDWQFLEDIDNHL
ncbi:hypothetical protein [Neobacillus niacini]|uniref:hypothetical protein n=1 Tax=Neobacillus niacini TaxID=86668 RepID=UPI001C8CFB2A|nr:hypothetical protein [Neobacillus niacini]MBY0148932.1 hypothetical protein [Neobacillus niacini]